MEVTEMNDYEYISNVLARTAQVLDDDDVKGWSNLFTEDVVFTVATLEIKGRQSLFEFMEARRRPDGDRGKHLHSNVIIEVDEEEGRARSYTDFIEVERSQKGAGRYIDDLVRESDGWRIAKRHIEVLPMQSQ
jgi:3-phenylpropionate/cinnamic acid dioxygenase small subunit